VGVNYRRGYISKHRAPPTEGELALQCAPETIANEAAPWETGSTAESGQQTKQGREIAVAVRGRGVADSGVFISGINFRQAGNMCIAAGRGPGRENRRYVESEQGGAGLSSTTLAGCRHSPAQTGLKK
jgi:hypothetical protein